jgi:hypothetical protein
VVGDLEGAEEGDPVVSTPLSTAVRKPNLKQKIFRVEETSGGEILGYWSKV